MGQGFLKHRDSSQVKTVSESDGSIAVALGHQQPQPYPADYPATNTQNGQVYRGHVPNAEVSDLSQHLEQAAPTQSGTEIAQDYDAIRARCAGLYEQPSVHKADRD